MTVVLFIVVLAILVFAHELGHFLAARSVGARVTEFGIGFPPRLYSWKPKGSETTYSINWIPFGGFVKLFKEDEDTGVLSPEEFAHTLDARAWWQKIWVLSAGVVFNVLLAWGLITAGLSVGLQMSVDESTQGIVGAPSVIALYVESNSPAARAGFIPGDAFSRLCDSADTCLTQPTLEEVQAFIGERPKETVTVSVDRNGSAEILSVVPEAREIEGVERAVIGVVLDTTATVKLPVWSAIIEGGKTTFFALRNVAVGLWEFLAQTVTGRADFSQIAGPVGIAGLTGDAASAGFSALLSFAAILSLNLAVINLIPFPALDGGRILFVLIETMKRSPIKPVVANTLNLIGFALLILLMIVVTVNDIVRLF